MIKINLDPNLNHDTKYSVIRVVYPIIIVQSALIGITNKSIILIIYTNNPKWTPSIEQEVKN